MTCSLLDTGPFDSSTVVYFFAIQVNFQKFDICLNRGAYRIFSSVADSVLKGGEYAPEGHKNISAPPKKVLPLGHNKYTRD